jgi:hypothetical protein
MLAAARKHSAALKAAVAHGFHRPIYSTTGGGGAAEAAIIRSSPPISMARLPWGEPRIPLFFVADDHRVQVNAHASDVSAVEGSPVRHLDPEHERLIGSGVSFATADGTRAEFEIPDRLRSLVHTLREPNNAQAIRTIPARRGMHIGVFRAEMIEQARGIRNIRDCSRRGTARLPLARRRPTITPNVRTWRW